MAHHPLLMSIPRERAPVGGIITSDLVLWLEAGNASSYPGSGTAWTDLSAESNDVTLINGPPTYSSSNGGSLDFDGTDDYGTIDTTSGFPTGAAAFTLQIWLTVDALPSSFGAALMYGTGATGEGRGITVNSSGNLIASGYSASVASTITVTLAQRYNVGYTYDGTTTRLYINGAEDANGARTLNTTLSIAKIGQLFDAAGEYWPGKLFQILMYDVALSASQIDANYDATVGTYG